MSEIRILLADDHPLVRKGIAAALSVEADFDVVAECANGAEALQAFTRLQPDVVIMDLVMPEMDGIEAIMRIRALNPKAQILVLTSFSTDDKVMAAVQAGAAGFLLKDSDPEDLVQAIRRLVKGESALHPAIARKLLSELSHHHEKPVEELTRREKEVLAFLAEGLTNQEIAERMVVSRATVHSHVSRILAKLELESRTQAALYAVRAGYSRGKHTESD